MHAPQCHVSVVQKKTLQAAGEMWRNFKSRLAAVYIRGSSKIAAEGRPWEVYPCITQEEWATFEAKYSNAEYKVSN